MRAGNHRRMDGHPKPNTILTACGKTQQGGRSKNHLYCDQQSTTFRAGNNQYIVLISNVGASPCEGPYTSCWQCWPSACFKCLERHFQGKPWGPYNCDACKVAKNILHGSDTDEGVGGMRSECEDSNATTEDTAGESTDLEEESVYNGNMDSPSSQEGSGIETPAGDMRISRRPGGPPELVRIDQLMYDLDGLSFDGSNMDFDDVFDGLQTRVDSITPADIEAAGLGETEIARKDIPRRNKILPQQDAGHQEDAEDESGGEGENSRETGGSGKRIPGGIPDIEGSPEPAQQSPGALLSTTTGKPATPETITLDSDTDREHSPAKTEQDRDSGKEATPPLEDRQASFLQGGYRIPKTKDSWQKSRRQARERTEARRERRHTSGDNEGSSSRDRKWVPKMRATTGRGYKPENGSPSRARRESSEERRLNDQERQARRNIRIAKEEMEKLRRQNPSGSRTDQQSPTHHGRERRGGREPRGKERFW